MEAINNVSGGNASMNNVVPITGHNSGNNGGGNSPASNSQYGAHTYTSVIRQSIDVVWKSNSLTIADLYNPGKMQDFECLLLGQVSWDFRAENALREKGEKWKVPQSLTPTMIAEILVRVGVFVRMITADYKSVLLMRMTTGPDKGVYKIVTTGGRDEVPTPEAAQLVMALNPTALTRDVAEVMRLVMMDMRLRTYSPERDDDTTGRLAWCNNGVYDVLTREFTAYDAPDFETKYGDVVRTWKLAVDYNSGAATLPVLHNDDDGSDWDIDTQFYDLFDVPIYDEAQKQAFRRAMWEIINFAARGISGEYAIWLVNTGSSIDGGNGKSCLTEILRGLIGTHTVMSTEIKDIGGKFALGDLPRKAAIISDETDADVDTIDRCATYKKLVTHEPVTIEKKNVNSYDYSGFRGVMIQGMNSMVKIASTGGSFWRRILVLRFERNFVTEGIDRDYIKSDYLNRREVLEAALYHALQLGMLPRISRDIVAACEPNKLDARGKSSQVWSYMSDIKPLLDDWMDAAFEAQGVEHGSFRLPIRLLYDCYLDADNGWAVSNGYRHTLTYPSFRTDLAGWCCANGATYYDPKTSTRVDAAQLQAMPDGGGRNPLLSAYRSAKWCYPSDVNARNPRICHINDTYRGVIELRK